MFRSSSADNNETSPGKSDSKSTVSASNDDLVPKKEATSTSSDTPQYFAKYARKLVLQKVLEEEVIITKATKELVMCNPNVNTWINQARWLHSVWQDEQSVDAVYMMEKEAYKQLVKIPEPGCN